jgi:LysM repeat protein
MIKLKYSFFCLLMLLCGLGLGQTRSSTIQTINGQKYYIHKIEKSQSLYGISRLYNVSLEDLYTANPELRTSGAKADQEIRVPVNTADPTAGTLSPASPTVQIDTNVYLTHRVAKGETVYSLTRQFRLTEKQLASYNPGITPASLKEGQLIIVGEKSRKKGWGRDKDKEPKQQPQPPLVKDHKAGQTEAVDSSLFRPALREKKTKYKVGLILPFRTEQTLALDLNELARSNSSFPTVPALAVDFYLGFKRAMDSLAANDFEVDLALYESDDKDSAKLDQILNDPGFKNLDIIFGPLYASEFKAVSKKAKELNIPIVSPITQQNKILYNNIYISKTNPSQFTLMESLADYCIDSLVVGNGHAILMLLSDKDKKELAFVSAFRKYYDDRQKALGKGLKDTITLARGISGLKQAFKPNTRNVVITLSANQVFLTDFSTQLAIFSDKKDVILCGWQNLTETDNIDQAYLNQLNFTFPHQFNLTSLATATALARSYAEQQQTLPGEYFYMGFDIAHYYLSHLKSTGPGFVHQLSELPMEDHFIRFKYTRPDQMTGFDNRGVYIFRYANYQLQKTGWK